MNGLTQPLGDWLQRPDEIIIARHDDNLRRQEEWRRQINTLGQQMLALPQQRWAICFTDSYLFSIALLATLHAGKVPILPGHYREAQLREQRDDFDGILSDLPLCLDCPVLAIPPAQRQPSPLPPLAPDARIVLFTSGSSGAPKAVSKSIRALDLEAQWLAARWHHRLRGCTVIASVSHQHLYGLTFRIMLPLACGIPFDSRQLLYSEQLAAQDPSLRYILVSSPAFLRRLDRTLNAPRCQLVISAGGVLTWPEAQALGRWFSQPVDDIYGSTETGVLASRRCEQEEAWWQPFADVRFRQDDQQNWWVSSPLVTGEPAQRLDDKLLFSERGFQLCGRNDRVVKIEDKRVSLSEVERRLLALPEVVEAVALAVRHPARSGIGVVLVLNRHYSDAEQMALRQQWQRLLRNWLEPVAVPRHWRIVEAIPQNSQSKPAWPQIQELFHVTR